MLLQISHGIRGIPMFDLRVRCFQIERQLWGRAEECRQEREGGWCAWPSGGRRKCRTALYVVSINPCAAAVVVDRRLKPSSKRTRKAEQRKIKISSAGGGKTEDTRNQTRAENRPDACI